jgi:hypothetical protein
MADQNHKWQTFWLVIFWWVIITLGDEYYLYIYKYMYIYIYLCVCIYMYVYIYIGCRYSSLRVMDRGSINWSQWSNQSTQPTTSRPRPPCAWPHAPRRRLGPAHPTCTARSRVPTTEPRAASHMRASPTEPPPVCAIAWGMTEHCSNGKWLSIVATRNDWPI